MNHVLCANWALTLWVHGKGPSSLQVLMMDIPPLPWPDCDILPYSYNHRMFWLGRHPQAQLLLLMSDWLWSNDVLPLQTGQIMPWSMVGLLWQTEQGNYNLHCWVFSSTVLPRNWRRSRGGLPTPGDKTHVQETESRELELASLVKRRLNGRSNRSQQIVELQWWNCSQQAQWIYRSNKMAGP